jgi:3-methyladenine DNA glycosylase AlkD
MSKFAELKHELEALRDPEKAKQLARFFKTGKGEYGEGDEFLGITVPEQRILAKKYRDLSLTDIDKLLQTSLHEQRLTALLILTCQFPKADAAQQAAIFDFYLQHTQWINNWDLVDVTCRPILGVYLLERDRHILYELAHAKHLWEQRIAIVTTMEFIKHNQFEDTLQLATILLPHPHDLIHKAVGWALREVGKKDQQVLISFLERYCTAMPRTMLRYVIEHFDQYQRKEYLGRKN